jgi:hypothetical protein
MTIKAVKASGRDTRQRLPLTDQRQTVGVSSKSNGDAMRFVHHPLRVVTEI